MTLPRLARRAAVPALLALFVICGSYSLSRDGATYDETAHLGAGLSYLQRGDFRLNPEHPPLAKAWAALPVAVAGLAPPDYGTPPWTGTARTSTGRATDADQWVFGFETINGPLAATGRRDPMRVLVPARLMILALGVGLGLLVYAWSRQLWGPGGAMLSLSLFVLSPTMLAHARLVTTDIAGATGFVAAAFALRWALASPSPGRTALAGLALGAALLTKFSTLLLLPALVLATGVWIGAGNGDGDPRPARRRARLAAYTLGGALLLAWLVVWSGYAFRFAATPGSAYELPWESRAARLGGIPESVATLHSWRALPEAFLFGLASAMQDEARLAYFNGEVSELGWRLYFPEAFVLKTAPALIALFLWGSWLVIRRSRARAADIAFLAAPALLYAAFTLGSRLNIGHRHLAPLEPFLFVACGAIAATATTRLRAWTAGALVAGGALSFVAATPGYLSYFNLFAGGARGGGRYLLDSNLDWGQDLPALERWMDREEIDEIGLAYFGTSDPKAVGIRYRKVIFVPDFRSAEPAVRPASGELVAVSANLVYGLYLEKQRHLFEEVARRRIVPAARLEEYAAMRTDLILRRERYPQFSEWVVDQRLLTPSQLEEAGSGLLASWVEWLRERGTLVDRAGDSILIYRVP